MTELVVLGAGSALELYAEALSATGCRVSVADLVPDRAAAAARAYGFHLLAGDVAAIPAGATVLNLTPPGVHGATTVELLERGHPVYSEKPVAHDPEHLARIVQCVARGARFAAAPDTHLSPAAVRAGELIRSGELGPVTAVHGSYRTPGHERWHPRPFTFYGPGGGVCLDIAPYFLRSSEALLGPVSLRSVRRTLGARPDLAPAAAAIPVPLRAGITLVTRSGLAVELDLAFGESPQESALRIGFPDHDLAFDPVDGGPALTLTERRSGAHTTLVGQTADTRGAGLRRFLAADPSDPCFGALDAATLHREQHLLLALDHGDTE